MPQSKIKYNFKLKLVRNHDKFYANVNSKLPIKHSFIQIANLIKNYKKSFKKKITIVDIGTATGTFANYLQSRFFEDNIVGYELLKPLIKVGKKNYPNVEIKQGNLLNKKMIQKSSTDIITLLGVLSIFNDAEKVVSNLLYWAKPGGKILIHGPFNPYNIDIFIGYKHSEKYQNIEMEAGWNIISHKTIKKLFINNGAKKIKFHEFDMPIDLKRNLNDPLRSWTEKLKSGKRQIINGLWIKQPQYILEVDV